MRRSTDLCSMCFPHVMDELTLLEDRRFAKHLKQCVRCQQEYAELTDLRYHAELEFKRIRTDSMALCLHPFTRQVYWLAASAMALIVGLSILPHHQHLLGRFAETASDVHAGITDHVNDFGGMAHRIFRIHGLHVNLKVPEI